MQVVLENTSSIEMKKSFRETALIVIFVAQAILSMGWIAVYPFGGYVILFLWACAFLCVKASPLKYCVYGLIVGLFAVFYMFPRPFGYGNTAWHLSLLVFSQMFFLNRQLFSEVVQSFVKCLILLCSASLIYRIIIYSGIEVPYQYIDLDPQVFNLYWPFYVERLNISLGDVDTVIGSFRFHGPFFEPGALGVALAVSLYGSASRLQLALIFVFGMLSLSMAFFFLAFFWLMEQLFLKKNFLLIVIAIIVVVLAFLMLDKSGFLYASSFGRLLGENDKVLNTRVSHFEVEQIRLFAETVTSNFTGVIFGIGWDIPGSGGSYRSWILGAGLLGMCAWFVAYFALLRKFVALNLQLFIFRFSSFLVLCYIWGNWFAPIFLFLWYGVSRIQSNESSPSSYPQQRQVL